MACARPPAEATRLSEDVAIRRAVIGPWVVVWAAVTRCARRTRSTSRASRATPRSRFPPMSRGVRSPGIPTVAIHSPFGPRTRHSPPGATSRALRLSQMASVGGSYALTQRCPPSSMKRPPTGGNSSVLGASSRSSRKKRLSRRRSSASSADHGLPNGCALFHGSSIVRTTSPPSVQTSSSGSYPSATQIESSRTPTHGTGENGTGARPARHIPRISPGVPRNSPPGPKRPSTQRSGDAPVELRMPFGCNEASSTSPLRKDPRNTSRFPDATSPSARTGRVSTRRPSGSKIVSLRPRASQTPILPSGVTHSPWMARNSPGPPPGRPISASRVPSGP